MKAISEIVGRGELAGGKATEVYRALRSLLCATCGAEIIEGTLFTRRRVKGIGLRIMPQCRKCEPFTLQAGGKEPSALLRTLLAQKSVPSPERLLSENASENPDREKNLKEQLERRLGPALKRSRRKKG